MKHLQNGRTILLHLMPAPAATADFAGVSHIAIKRGAQFLAFGYVSVIQCSGESGCR